MRVSTAAVWTVCDPSQPRSSFIKSKVSAGGLTVVWDSGSWGWRQSASGAWSAGLTFRWGVVSGHEGVASCPGCGPPATVAGLHALRGVILSLGRAGVERACLGQGGTFMPSQDCSFPLFYQCCPEGSLKSYRQTSARVGRPQVRGIQPSSLRRRSVRSLRTC